MIHSAREALELRASLAWQPLFGCGLRIDYVDTLDLPMDEVLPLLDLIAERRRAEWKAAFPHPR